MKEEEYATGNTPAGHKQNPSVALRVGGSRQVSAQREGYVEIAKSRLKQLGDDNFDLLYETFVLKEKAHDIAQVCLSESMAQLHQVYMGAMKRRPG